MWQQRLDAHGGTRGRRLDRPGRARVSHDDTPGGRRDHGHGDPAGTASTTAPQSAKTIGALLATQFTDPEEAAFGKLVGTSSPADYFAHGGIWTAFSSGTGGQNLPPSTGPGFKP